MAAEQHPTRSSADELLRLHDALDELHGEAGLWRGVRVAAVVGILGFVGVRVLQLAIDVGLGPELGIVLFAAGGVATADQVWKRVRANMIRRQIAEIECRAESPGAGTA